MSKHSAVIGFAAISFTLAAGLGASLMVAQTYGANNTYQSNTSYPTYSSSPSPKQSPTTSASPTGYGSPAPAPVSGGSFLRGDANRDGRVDISDIIHIGMAIDQPNPPPGRRGETRLISPCWDAADANDDGHIDINDAIAIISAKFGGNGTLPAPYPLAGTDPTSDGLGCDSYQAASWTLFLRGDANNDLRVDISDASFIQNHVSRSGPAPKCPDAADVNDDGQVTAADAEAILNFKFKGGVPPKAPYPDLGGDPSADALGCPAYP